MKYQYNKNDTKYRIKEYQGKFTIEIWCYESKLCIYFYLPKFSWVEANRYGEPIETLSFDDYISKEFYSLEAAREQIREWEEKKLKEKTPKEKPIYHNP